MTRTVRYDNWEAMVEWAHSKMPGGEFRDDARAIGLELDQKLIAVAVFDTFGPSDCNVSVAAEATLPWMTRQFCRHVAAFPFLTCGFRRISTLVSEHNAAAIQFNRHMGMVEEGRKRQGGVHGEDQLMFGMLRSECRWLPKTINVPRQS